MNIIKEKTDDNRLFLRGMVTGIEVCFIELSLIYPEAEVINIEVAPEYRRQGLGRELLTAAQNMLKSKGYSVLFLEVDKENIAARRLYESEGFVSFSERKNYYGTGKDAINMRKVL